MCSSDLTLLGNVQKNSIVEIVDSEKLSKIKEDFLEGKTNPNCVSCDDIEKRSGFSNVKNQYNKSFPDIHAGIKKLDIRWSNLCNLHCIYCDQYSSSTWAEKYDPASVKNIQNKNDIDLENWILARADQLDELQLLGGEPLLMKQNLELLELLLKVNPNVNLRINTNLSNVDTKVFETACKFQNVHWTISVETLNDEYEYIRYGGNWFDFMNNLTTISQLDHKITFNMLHFLLNYLSVFECVDWFRSLGFHPNSFVIGALLNPNYLNIRHLPKTTLKQVEQELQRRINQNPGYLLEDSYRNMLHYINTPADKDLQNSFEQLAKLDQRRNLDSKKIFTSLYKEHYHGKTI